MILYHGTNKNFDKFNLNYVGEGEGSSLISHGIYFSESKDVANFYANKLKENSNQLFCYECKLIDNLCFLSYEGGIEEQDFNLEDILNIWYGEDFYEEELEAILENEDLPMSVNYDDLKESFHVLLTDYAGGEYNVTNLKDEYPEVDWESIHKRATEKNQILSLTLEQSTGQMLDANINNVFKNKEDVLGFYKKINISGMRFKNIANEHDNNINNYVVWNFDNFKVINKECIFKNKKKKLKY